MKKSFLAMVFGAFASMSVNATHHCAGIVNNVDVAGNGAVHVNIEGIGDGNVICSLTAKRGDYTAESCKAVFSMALSAKMAQKRLRLYFRNDGDTSCNKGSWKDFTSSSYDLYFVRLEG